MAIDWNDERAIGLMCWFEDSSLEHEERGTLVALHTVDNVQMFEGRYKNDKNWLYSDCRIAQGEKTPYDGKEQPVPDGVMVRIWLPSGNSNIAVSSDINWVMNCNVAKITHYQVQEMPEEKQTRTKIPAGTASAINAATGEKIALDAKTVPIKQSTIGEVVTQLENLKEIFQDEADRNKSDLSADMEAIDKLIKELKDKL